MLKLFLLDAVRSLLRHKVRSLVNIASLTIGLSIFGFSFLYVKQELSFDRGWADAGRVHRLVLERRGVPGMIDGQFTSVPSNTWLHLTDYFDSQIEHMTRITNWSARVAGTTDSSVYPLTFVDPGFAEIFQLEIVEGDMARVLSGPGFIALEESYAERIGYADGVGRRLTLTSGNDGSEVEYEVSAIYRVPQPTSISYTQITLIHEYSAPLLGDRRPIAWDTQAGLWLKVKKGIETGDFNALQPTFIQQDVSIYNDVLGPSRKISEHLFYHWQPLTNLHFNPIANSTQTSPGDPLRVMTFAIVGLLVLLVGCSNSISLSLASALERRREIGVRKTIGALQQNILKQHLGEAVLLALLALIPAMFSLEWLREAFQALLPFTMRIDVNFGDYMLMTFIACGVGLASGAYPALVLASTKPQVLMKTDAKDGKKSGITLRTLLVGVQFCFASMLLIGATALYIQLTVTRAQPLGFNPSNIIFLAPRITRNTNFSASATTAELEKIPGVTWAIPAFSRPNANLPVTANQVGLVRSRADENETHAERIVAERFVDALGMHLLAGRDFDPTRDSLDPRELELPTASMPPEIRMLFNATAVRELGFGSPEEAIENLVFLRSTNTQDGKVTLMPVRIIGVVEDNLFSSVKRHSGPVIYQWVGMDANDGFKNFMLKYEDAVEAGIVERINEVLTRVTGQSANLSFVEADIDAAFQLERNESKLLLICTGIALLLASAGLFGLAALSMERQQKEVGVRKVFGASSSSIVALFLLRFLRPVVVANILAWPVALYFVLLWIQRFPYQVERTWLLVLCIGSALMVLLISIVTVVSVTARGAASSPTHSLRYE